MNNMLMELESECNNIKQESNRIQKEYQNTIKSKELQIKD